MSSSINNFSDFGPIKYSIPSTCPRKNVKSKCLKNLTNTQSESLRKLPVTYIIVDEDKIPLDIYLKQFKNNAELETQKENAEVSGAIVSIITENKTTIVAKNSLPKGWINLD